METNSASSKNDENNKLSMGINLYTVYSKILVLVI